MVPKFKPTNRFAKHRSLKIRDLDRVNAMRRRPLKTQSRHRVDDHVRKDVFDELHSDDFRESKHSDLHEDSMEFTRRATTARVIRRKPRDRFEKVQSDDDDPLADLGLSLGDRGVVKNARLDDYRLSDTEFLRGGMPPRRPAGGSFSDKEFHRSSGFERRPPGESDIFPEREEAMEKPIGKQFEKEYSDYYDMKRVQSIKNNLPSLLRVTTEGKLYDTLKRFPLKVHNYLFMVCIRSYFDNFKNFYNFVFTELVCIYMCFRYYFGGFIKHKSIIFQTSCRYETHFEECTCPLVNIVCFAL